MFDWAMGAGASFQTPVYRGRRARTAPQLFAQSTVGRYQYLDGYTDATP
jgi:hypothetical protein